MIKIEKILWAYDGSEEAKAALNHAVFLARRFGSEILGIHVVVLTRRLLYEYLRKHPQIDIYGILDRVEEDYNKEFASIGEELKAQGISFKGYVCRNEPDKEILKYATDNGVDLIVMGKRGRGLVNTVLVGSTTIKVLRRSKIPVFVAKRRNGKGEECIRNILVPLDISERLNSVLGYTMEFAKTLNAVLHVLYVLSLHMYEYDFPHSVIRDLKELSAEELRRRVDRVSIEKGEGVDIRTDVVYATNPYLGIIDYALTHDIDLISMSTHGRKGVKRLVLGSVTEKVISDSPCSVLVLNP